MSTTTMAEKIFTLDQVAKLLGFHRNTVRKWILDGDLVASQLGKEYRIRESDLNELLRKKQIQPRKEKEDGA